MFLPFDPAADGDNPFGLREVDSLPRFLKWSLWLLANRTGINRDRHWFDRRSRLSALCGIRAERTDLERDEMRRRTNRFDVSAQLPLKHRARIDRAPAVARDCGHICHEGAPKPCGQRWHEVASLICVWKENQRRRELLNDGRKRDDVSIGGVLGKRWRVNDRNSGDRRDRDLSRRRISSATEDDDVDRVPTRLRRGNSFPRRAVEFSAALLTNNQDHY